MDDHLKVTGVWLRREGQDAVVLVEINGAWVRVITEMIDGQFSHIVNPSGVRREIEAGNTEPGA